MAENLSDAIHVVRARSTELHELVWGVAGECQPCAFAGIRGALNEGIVDESVRTEEWSVSADMTPRMSWSSLAALLSTVAPTMMMSGPLSAMPASGTGSRRRLAHSPRSRALRRRAP